MRAAMLILAAPLVIVAAFVVFFGRMILAVPLMLYAFALDAVGLSHLADEYLAPIIDALIDW